MVFQKVAPSWLGLLWFGQSKKPKRPRMSVNHGVCKTSIAVQCLEWFCTQCDAGPTKIVYAREVAAIIAYMLDHLQGIAALAYDSRFMPQRYQDVDKLINLLKQLASPLPVLDNINKFELPHDEHSKRLLNTLVTHTLSHPGIPSITSFNSNGELAEPLGLPDFCGLGSNNASHQAGHQAGHHNGHHDGHHADLPIVERNPHISQPDTFEDYLPAGPNGLDGNNDEDVQDADQEARQDDSYAVRPHNNVARRLPDLVETNETGKKLWYLSLFTIPRGSKQLAKEVGNLIACINFWWTRQRSSRQFSMFIHRVDGNPVYVAIKATSTERDFPRIELAKFLRDFYGIDLGWLGDDDHSAYGRGVVAYSNGKSIADFSEDTTKKILAQALGKRSYLGCMIFPTEFELVVGAPSQSVCNDIVTCIKKFMTRRGPIKRKPTQHHNIQAHN